MTCKDRLGLQRNLCECDDPEMPGWFAAACQCDCHLFDYPQALSTTETVVRSDDKEQG